MHRQTTATITATEITHTGHSSKASSDRSINQSFHIFMDFYVGMQDAEVTKSLHT